MKLSKVEDSSSDADSANVSDEDITKDIPDNNTDNTEVDNTTTADVEQTATTIAADVEKTKEEVENLKEAEKNILERDEEKVGNESPKDKTKSGIPIPIRIKSPKISFKVQKFTSIQFIQYYQKQISHFKQEMLYILKMVYEWFHTACLRSPAHIYVDPRYIIMDKNSWTYNNI